jgi:DNA-binding NarL/FixJ family response regulator
MAEGKRMKGIAAELDISVRTVENHKAHLLQVLGLGSTADLVRFAIKRHIVPD